MNAKRDDNGPVDPRTADQPAVVAITKDLMLSIRIQDVVERAGGRAVVVEDARTGVDALDRNFPVLALIDLAVSGDWADVIRRCKLRPHTRRIPLYAFGSHVDAATLQAAREAGADHAWARSRMMAQLAEVVDRHVNPSARYPAGWDDELSETARAGLVEFNKGDYYEQHELLEKAWLAEKRPIREMYQGVLQIGLAFYQIERNNWAGAVKMFQRGLPKLRGLPAVCQGVRIEAFRIAAQAIHAEIVRLGPAHLHEFDRNRFPRIEMEKPRNPLSRQ